MPTPPDPPIDSRWRWRLANCGVAVFGLLMVWFCGHRGVFLQDQSMVLDGAWRILQGQVPYRDTLYPFGPITFLIQALFFRAFGVDFSVTVLSAAVLNAVAGLLVVRIVNALCPGHRIIALLAGVATGCWFQAPFGTLWFEQTAFFFGLVALLVALEGELRIGSRSHWLHAIGGVFVALSVLSKQNAGLLFYPVFAGIAAIPHLREPRAALNRLAAQLSGFVFGLGCFFTWLWLFSSPRQFLHYSIDVSFSLAAQRAPGSSVLLVGGLLTLNSYPLSIRWCALFFALTGLGAMFAGVFRWTQSPSQAKAFALGGWIILSCLEFEQLFIISTYNEAENGLPFLGLAGGLALGFLSSVMGRQGIRFSLSSGQEILQANLSGRTSRRLMVTASILLWLTLMLQGARASWKRYVQQFTPASRFTETLNVDGMRRLKWADLSYADRTNLVSDSRRIVSGPDWWLRKSDFEAVNEWLARNPGNFFVFGDSTMLYGLHRRISPEPWLYLVEGHSYLRSDLAHVDETVTASLDRSALVAVIVEKVSWEGSQDADWLIHMPRLKAWIDANFKKEKEFGIYEVWVARRR